MPMVVERSLGLVERLRAFGPLRDIEVQDAMARITLDVIMATGFDLHWDAVDLEKPCPLLEDMHFLMAETFRQGFTRPLHRAHAWLLEILIPRQCRKHLPAFEVPIKASCLR
jgi:hypothetical protein